MKKLSELQGWEKTEYKYRNELDKVIYDVYYCEYANHTVYAYFNKEKSYVDFLTILPDKSGCDYMEALQDMCRMLYETQCELIDNGIPFDPEEVREYSAIYADEGYIGYMEKNEKLLEELK